MSKIKLSVCGVIMYQSKFLIVKRSETDDFLPNCWEFPGGGVEDGETISEALKREIKEEIGLDISNEYPQLIGISEEFMNEEKTERYLQLNYKIVMDTEPNMTLSSEHVTYDWATKDDSRLDDFLKEIIRQVETDK
jgi:8-oxo-dGTP diphosphatase